MPTLSNPRHELFAQARARGAPAITAYIEAGYTPDRGNAAKLTTKNNIKARIEELAMSRQMQANALTLIQMGKGLELMAQIVTTPVHAVDSTSWMAQEVKRTTYPDGRVVEVVKMPSKMDALKTIGEWCGYKKGEGKDVAEDPLGNLVRQIVARSLTGN